MTLNTAVLVPMPIASVTTIVAESIGRRRIDRSVYLRSPVYRPDVPDPTVCPASARPV